MRFGTRSAPAPDLNIVDPSELSVPRMTRDEIAWCRKAARLFAEMPPRLKLLEAADSVMVIDGIAGRDVDLHDGFARENGVVLADLNSALFKITGVSA